MDLPKQTNHGTNVDVLVIGRGIAGAMAALRARELGASVALVHSSAGASVQTSGAFNIADALSLAPKTAGKAPLDVGDNWDKLVETVVQTHPNHFYAQISSAQRSKFLKAIKCFGKHLHSLVDVPDVPGPNKVLATSLGTFKHAAICQRSGEFDFNQLPNDCLIGVVDFTGLLGYEAKPLIRMLEWMASLTAHRPFRFVPMTVDFCNPTMPWKSPLQAAAAMDDPKNQARFYKAFAKALSAFQPEPKFFLLPPVMAVEATTHIINTLEETHRIHAREILSGSQSVMGQRLSRALDSALRKSEVEMIQGGIQGWDSEDGIISSVTLKLSDSQRRVHPKQVILATGKHLGGGLKLKSRWVEPIFNLSPYIGDRPFAEVHPTEITTEGMQQTQPIFEGGLRYDDALRPKDAFMNVPHKNLRAAGSLLSGTDTMQDGTASGTSILSGYLAGELATSSDNS